MNFAERIPNVTQMINDTEQELEQMQRSSTHQILNESEMARRMKRNQENLVKLQKDASDAEAANFLNDLITEVVNEVERHEHLIREREKKIQFQETHLSKSKHLIQNLKSELEHLRHLSDKIVSKKLLIL